MFDKHLFETQFNTGIKKEKQRYKQWASQISSIEERFQKNIINFSKDEFFSFFNNSFSSSNTDSKIYYTTSTFDNFKGTINAYYKKTNTPSNAFNVVIEELNNTINQNIEINEFETIYDREWLYNLNNKIMTTRNLAIIYLIYEGLGGCASKDCTFEEIENLKNEDLIEHERMLKVPMPRVNFTRYIKLPIGSNDILSKAKNDLGYYKQNEIERLNGNWLKPSVYLIKSIKENEKIKKKTFIDSLFNPRLQQYLEDRNLCPTLVQTSGIMDYLGLVDYYDGKLEIENVKKVLYRFGLEFNDPIHQMYYKYGDFYKKLKSSKPEVVENNRRYYKNNDLYEVYGHIIETNLPDISFKSVRGSYNHIEIELEEKYTDVINQHCKRERDEAFIKQKKKEFYEKHKEFFCQICKLNFEKVYGATGKDFIEFHHLIPLAYIYKMEDTYKELKHLQDYVMVCSNCHSMLHRLSYWENESNINRIRDLKEKEELSISEVFMSGN